MGLLLHRDFRVSVGVALAQPQKKKNHNGALLRDRSKTHRAPKYYIFFPFKIPIFVFFLPAVVRTGDIWLLGVLKWESEGFAVFLVVACPRRCAPPALWLLVAQTVLPEGEGGGKGHGQQVKE